MKIFLKKKKKKKNLNHFINLLLFLETTEEGKIPLHLNTLMKILLEEDEEFGDNAGPCLEYFFEEKIADTLCALCLIDVTK